MTDVATIVVADDRPDNRDLVCELLTFEGYRVLPAANGQQALAIIREHLPDLVILDLDMPIMNGYQVCTEMKIDPGTSEIPVLMLTAWGAPDQRVKGLQLGAEDYLVKPFDYRELLARVRARLRNKQQADDLRFAREKIRRTFEHYVSPRVVERLLAGAAEVRLGGVQQTVTVLFADLRGFSSMAQQLPPDQLVDVLNGHLTAAAKAILAFEGTISQYSGDLVVALFNAPLPQPDHAQLAVQAAWQLRREMADFHAGLPEHLQMAFGVGIVTGEAVVGNIGARELFTYTAIGDTVNMSQRLEEMAAGGQILMTETTSQALDERATLEDLGLVVLRGRTEPVRVYSLVSFAERLKR